MFSLPAGEPYPLVTIVTATYNSEKTIRDTLNSVASQDYPRIEHVIIDGASKDNTLSVVREYQHVSRIISEKDQGIYDAMNRGITFSSGDIIGILNSDDFYVSTDVISKVVEKMISEKTDTLYADLVYVHPEQTQKVIRTWIAGKFQLNKFLFGWMPPHPTFFVHRRVYEKLGAFNINLRSAADYELMLRFLYKGNMTVSYLPQVIVKMRAGGMSNASLANRIKANREDREAWRVNQLQPHFYTTLLKPLRKLIQFIRKPNSTI
jgi:glycosyltransferase involved in cell wall biosynthesis